MDRHHLIGHTLRRHLAALAAVTAAVVLVACQQGAGGRASLSLDEAKQVTADFGGRSFTPPPRMVTDVTAILEKQAQDDLEMVERSRKEADAQPRDTDGARTLSNFYYDRGLAASRIGRSGQEIADYRKAMK